MKVIIDEDALRKDLHPGHDFQKTLQGHKDVCTLLGEFCDAAEVEYKPYYKGETYILRKGGKSLSLHSHATSIDGGWLSVEES